MRSALRSFGVCQFTRINKINYLYFGMICEYNNQQINERGKENEQCLYLKKSSGHD